MSQKIRPRHPTICITNKNEYSRTSATAGAVYLPQANTEGGAAGYNRGRAPRHGSGAKFLPRLQMSQKFRPRHPTEPKFLRHLEIGFAHIEEAANKLNSFVSANVAQIKRLQVVNFVVFCVVLANFLKNLCHNIILMAQDHTRSRPMDGSAAVCAQ